MSFARPLQPPTSRGYFQKVAEIVADDVRLARLGRRLLLGGVLLLVTFAGYYGYDRYVVRVASPVDQATQALEDQIRQSPDDIDLRLRVAALYARQERFDQAVAQYGEALKVRKDWPPALLGLAAVEEARGNDQRAEGLYRQVADRFRDTDYRYAARELQLVYYRLAVFSAKAGRNQEAESWANEALQVDNTDSDALYVLGTSQEAQGNLQAASESFQKGVGYDPSFKAGWTALQRVSSATGDHILAEYALGMSQFAAGDLSASIATLQNVTAVSPDFAAAYEGLGLAYAKQNDAESARQAFRAALDRDPNRILSDWSLRSLGGQQ